MTRMLRYLVVGSLALPACESSKAESPKPSPVVTARIEPWETFDDRFDGCAGGCGQRMTAATPGVIAQPGAMIGQRTYCPVSGVAFEIKPTSAHRTVGQTTLYFCCESCAAYFTANQATILAARGISA